MRIALLSLFKSPNYGAILQSYALQVHLKDLGFDSEYIPYSRHEMYSVPKRIKNRLYHIISYLFGYRKREKRTSSFRQNYLSIARNQQNEQYEQYDVFLVGSDQVWKPELLDSTDSFFFVPFSSSSNKVSYASSFGVSELPKKYQKRYCQLLESFKSISVREREGIEILGKLGITGASCVCDPTFLLSKQHWKRLIGNRIIQEDYILCYVMTGDIPTANYVHDTAKRWVSQLGTNLKVFIIGDRDYRKLKPGYNLICDAGPMEFLNYTYYASYVITSSFHGTCFSLIFGKKFVNVLNPLSPYNNRVLNLHRVFGLKNQLAYTGDKLFLAPPNDCLHEVQHRINEERKHADSFLITALSSCCKNS